MLLNF